MNFAEFTRQMDLGHGTLIVERYSFKGPTDWWWTEDNTYQLCPYPVVDWLVMTKNATFQPVFEWYRENYTGVKTGRAFLVAASDDEHNRIELGRKLVTTGLEKGMWVEIAPFDKFE